MDTTCEDCGTPYSSAQDALDCKCGQLPLPQQCGLCGAFLPKPVPGKPYVCGKCGAEFENLSTLPADPEPWVRDTGARFADQDDTPAFTTWSPRAGYDPEPHSSLTTEPETNGQSA